MLNFSAVFSNPIVWICSIIKLIWLSFCTPFSTKISISDISTSHKRTEKAIELQGLNLAHKLLTTELKDKEDVTEIYGFSIQQINEYYEFKQKQDLERKEKQQLLKEKKKKEIIEVSNEMSLSDYLKQSDESYLDIQLNEEQQLAYDKVTNSFLNNQIK